MPSRSSLLRTSGFRQLLAVSGEVLRVGREGNSFSFRAVVNKKTSKLKDVINVKDGGTVDFNLLGFAEVEFLKGSPNPEPVAGTIFTEEDGNRLRVRHVTNTDITWVCFCQPSPK